jgi:hypothetical protein
MDINAFKGEIQLRQKCEYILTYVFLIYCIFSIPSVSGHSPLISGDTDKLDEAMLIPDPTKSWAIYGELHERVSPRFVRKVSIRQ